MNTYYKPNDLTRLERARSKYRDVQIAYETAIFYLKSEPDVEEDVIALLRDKAEKYHNKAVEMQRELFKREAERDRERAEREAAIQGHEGFDDLDRWWSRAQAAEESERNYKSIMFGERS